MPKYQLTERGIKEARKKRTALKGFGEAVTFGGPWKGEEYSNILLLELLHKPRKARDAYDLTRETFNPPRPSVAKVAQVMSNLTNRGFVRIVEPKLSKGVYADRGNTRISRRHHRGWKRVY
jgi:hypothetical protein